jgi:hypothetical protein
VGFAGAVNGAPRRPSDGLALLPTCDPVDVAAEGLPPHVRADLVCRWWASANALLAEREECAAAGNGVPTSPEMGTSYGGLPHRWRAPGAINMSVTDCRGTPASASMGISEIGRSSSRRERSSWPSTRASVRSRKGCRASTWEGRG